MYVKTNGLGRIRREATNGKSALYNYSIEHNEFANLWYKMHHDLGYPLQIDSRYKRAIVMNKQGLEKKIEKMITGVMEENFNKLVEMATKDIENILNSATQTITGDIVVGKSGSHTSMVNLLAKSATKGLVKGIFNIVDDIINDNNKKNRW